MRALHASAELTAAVKLYRQLNPRPAPGAERPRVGHTFIDKVLKINMPACGWFTGSLFVHVRRARCRKVSEVPILQFGGQYCGGDYERTHIAPLLRLLNFKHGHAVFYGGNPYADFSDPKQPWNVPRDKACLALAAGARPGAAPSDAPVRSALFDHPTFDRRVLGLVFQFV